MTESDQQPPPDKMNIVDSASLTFFTNPAYLNILQRKKLCSLKDNAEEVKFYRKRITTLFKELLKENTATVEIKEIHTMFVNSAIRYFEMVDKKDIIQEHNQAQGQTQGDSQRQEQVPNEEGEFPAEIGDCTLDEANDLMMRKTITVANLDNYVINKQDTSTNDTRIIPMKIDIDLKTQDLKTKGVPPKKIKKSKISTEDLSN
jgi:hypothetical protein